MGDDDRMDGPGRGRTRGDFLLLGQLWKGSEAPTPLFGTTSTDLFLLYLLDTYSVLSVTVV